MHINSNSRDSDKLNEICVLVNMVHKCALYSHEQPRAISFLSLVLIF